jgi:hypothetical protein
MDPIEVRPVARGVVEANAIILHVSDDDTRRLVFLPIIHDNETKNGSVNGRFVYQRKRKNEFWDDDWEKISVPGETLSALKAGEGYQLPLHSDDVTKLISGLMQIEGIAEQIKGVHTRTTFIPTADEIAPFMQRLLENTTNEVLLEELSKLDSDVRLRLNDLILRARIRSALKYWDGNKKDAIEENWQKFFAQRPWIFTLILAEPIVLLKAKMYVGGTNASGSGGKTVDYGLINKQTKNTAIVEIKTPVTPLIGTEYRGLYPQSNDLNGSVIQVRNYKREVQKNVLSLKEDWDDFEAIDIPNYVIIGNTSELDTKVKARSFELGRRNNGGTVILAFDEVFEKLRILCED